MLAKNSILKTNVTSETEQSILEYVERSVEKKTEKFYIVTPNPEILVYANHHPSFKTILNNAQIALPDGIGVHIAGMILGKPFKQRVTGVDLMIQLCKSSAKKPITVGFLGGGPGIAEKTAERLVAKFPELKVSFIGQEWSQEYMRGNTQNFTQKNAGEVSVVSRTLPRSSAVDILFVAFGFPKQEEWISENLEKLPVQVMMGVGGAFDYISGRVPRAPLFIRRFGFEWFYRLVRQPWRVKRQLALIEFIYLVVKERLDSLFIVGK